MFYGVVCAWRLGVHPVFTRVMPVSYALCFLLLPSVKKTPRASLDRKARDITTQQQQLTKTVSGESTEWSEVVGGAQDTVASASLSLLLYHITFRVRYSVPTGVIPLVVMPLPSTVVCRLSDFRYF